MIYRKGIYDLKDYFEQHGRNFSEEEVYEMCKKVVENSDNFDYVNLDLNIELMGMDTIIRLTGSFEETIPDSKFISITKAYLSHKFKNIEYHYGWVEFDSDWWLKGESYFDIKAKVEDNKIMVSFDDLPYEEFKEE